MSAIKANIVLYDLPFHVLDHAKVKYFLKAHKINRPLNLKSHNVITIPWLVKIPKTCKAFTSAVVYRAIFLLGWTYWLSNLAPHPIAGFDASKHLTGQDIFFTKKHIKVIIKWSKTMQTRDMAQCLTLPKA